jgi:CxxC motif-containing protein
MNSNTQKNIVTLKPTGISATTTASLFDKQIQKWIEMDNRIKKINAELKTSRDLKNDIETSIMEIVNNKKLLNTSLALPDGRLRFVETKITNPISLTFIEKCLNELIPNKSQVQHILKYMKDKRDIKTNPEIKRYYNN